MVHLCCDCYFFDDGIINFCPAAQTDASLQLILQVVILLSHIITSEKFLQVFLLI